MRSAATVVGFVCLFWERSTQKVKREVFGRSRRGLGEVEGEQQAGRPLDQRSAPIGSITAGVEGGGTGRGSSLLPAHCQSAKVTAVAAFLQNLCRSKWSRECRFSSS